MSLHCIVWCCRVLYCWLWRAGCISQDTYLLYIICHIICNNFLCVVIVTPFQHCHCRYTAEKHHCTLERIQLLLHHQLHCRCTVVLAQSTGLQRTALHCTGRRHWYTAAPWHCSWCTVHWCSLCTAALCSEGPRTHSCMCTHCNAVHSREPLTR